MSNPQSIIQQLINAGMKEREIADALREDGVEISIPTLNRIKNGIHRSTSFDIGMGLVRLYERRQPGKPATKASAA
jgi:hypothetical protein